MTSLIRHHIYAETIEQYWEVLAKNGWEGSVCQTAPGQLAVEFSMLQAGGFSAFKTQLGTASAREMQAPGEGLTLGLVIPGSNSNRWCQHQHDSAVLLKMPQTDFTASNKQGIEGYQFHFRPELLERLQRLLDIPRLPAANSALLSEIDRRRCSALMGVAGKLWEVGQGLQALELAETLLAEILQEFAGQTVVAARTDPVRRQRIYRQAREYMHTYMTDDFSLAELCEYLGCSRRSLTHAFSENLGIPPKQYLKMLRLNGVRALLQNRSAPLSNVTDTANIFGFWHMGQFARDYRGCFGELPSETLARSR